MNKIWEVANKADELRIKYLCDSLKTPTGKLNSIIANLLLQRNITSYTEAKNFFRPMLEQLHYPFLMKDMDKAVERLEKAIINNEKIIIYGDYDVDGTTSVALVYSFLSEYVKPENIKFYIPNRDNEGYGISITGIDFAKENDVSLVIALDCGIKANDKIEYANTLGIDFIICDHHNPGEYLPKSLACLDPKRLDCDYPDKNLSGCGVGFKLLQAFCLKRNIDQEKLHQYLDYVAVSIASDIVPITGENRILAHYGLKQLNSNPSLGLKHLIKSANASNKELSVSDIVFKVGPRINAAGRMDSANAAVELLISSNDKDAKDKSKAIDGFNNNRKEFDKEATDEALDKIKNDKQFTKRKSTVVYKKGWHKGVIGIVASRLIEHHYKPTVVLCESNGLYTGSARSVFGFNVYNAIEYCSPLLESFGGHMYAAGLTLKEENIENFERMFEKYVSENITEELLTPRIEIDSYIDFKDINDVFLRVLKQFEPLGPGNLRPVFTTKDVYDYGTGKAVGKDEAHLKLDLISKKSNERISAIAFKMGKYIDRIRTGEAFDICYTIEENEYRGNVSIQLQIIDIRFHQK